MRRGMNSESITLKKEATMARTKKRLPKKEYFKMRYQQAVDNGNEQKAQYFKSRFLQEIAKELAA
jgi:ribosomal protein L29